MGHPYTLRESGMSKTFSVTWSDVTANDTCDPYKIGVHTIVSVHVFGTFPGNCRIVAGNCPENLAPVHGSWGEIELLGPSFVAMDIDAEFIAPAVTGHDDTKLTVVLKGRK